MAKSKLKEKLGFIGYVFSTLVALPLVALGWWDVGGDGIICGGLRMPRSLKIINIVLVIGFWFSVLKLLGVI